MESMLGRCQFVTAARSRSTRFGNFRLKLPLPAEFGCPLVVSDPVSELDSWPNLVRSDVTKAPHLVVAFS